MLEMFGGRVDKIVIDYMCVKREVGEEKSRQSEYDEIKENIINYGEGFRYSKGLKYQYYLFFLKYYIYLYLRR